VVLDMKEAAEIRAEAADCRRVKKQPRRAATLPLVPKFHNPQQIPAPTGARVASTPAKTETPSNSVPPVLSMINALF
jgi:hypothetical protein